MNLTGSRFNAQNAKLAVLLGTASLFTMAQAISAQAQQVAQGQTAQAEEVPENVLITGSLIRGAAAVGVPVTNLNPQDFAMTGAVTTAELFRTVPAANVAPGPVATMSGANIERATRVNIRGLDTGDATRSLLMVDGLRVPAQGNGVCEIDPSIIPALALDRIDILVDGASATYGSDAIAGVINIILKRNYDGAVTQFRYTGAPGGKNRYLASQLWGRTWDGGDITLSYEWYDDSPIPGNAHSNLTVNFSPWGLDNRIPIQSSLPATVSIGQASSQIGTTCTNCFAIPHGAGGNFVPGGGGVGPTAAYSASTLNWATFGVAANGGTNGTRNAFNPYLLSWYDAAQQRNAATITLDQRLTKDISFYGEAFYNNRRAEYYNPAHLSPSSSNDLLVAVPSFNPYYPTGGAPTNLRVGYNLDLELPSFTDAYELADRYMGGLHIALPYGWNADLYYAQTYDSSFNHVTNVVNRNAVSAALGWTIPVSAAQGTTPAIASWTKPSNVPYLNVFCDPTAFQCNSPTTLNYVTAIRSFNEKYWINEKGIKADGPLFDLPAGTLKAALGMTYTTSTFSFVTFDSTGSSTLLAPMLTDNIHRQVWAGFAELNIPVFSDQFNIPGFRKVQIAASWRHDQYSDYGGTSNPKVSLDWVPIEEAGVTFHASWGSNFRAPGFGETSPLANNAITGWNANDIFAQTSNININCNAPVGSGANRIFNPGATNSLPGLTGFSGICGSTATPVGVALLGSSQTAQTAGFRNFVNTSGLVLHPEQTNNWSVGAEFAPTAFLKGLDLSATWYSIRIGGVLGAFGNPTTNSFNQSSLGFAYIVPTDLAYLHPGNPAQCHNNNSPTDCPEFEQMVQGILNDGRNPVPQSILTRVQWINDGGIFNKGTLKTQGVDWTASYDFDAGDFGAWNIGMVGTYYLNQIRNFPQDSIFPGNTAQGFGAETVDGFHQTIASLGLGASTVAQAGVETAPRMHYRGRLGWSNGPFNVTGFVNYDSHFYHTQSAPPNVNGQCLATNPGLGGGTFPCTIEGYSNIEPSYYTFDLSFGYDTGDTPANEYLRNVAVQLVVQNILDKHPPFEYRISTGGGNPTAFDLLKSDQGRTFSIIVTKTW
jgi:outer membrane receptor protein involved in Fe transport